MDDQPGLNEPPNESDGKPDVFVPKVMAEPGAPVPAQEENAMIEESVRFINQTVAEMVFGASVIIGEHLLTRYFAGDIALAMSKAHNKPVSFNRLCISLINTTLKTIYNFVILTFCHLSHILICKQSAF